MVSAPVAAVERVVAGTAGERVGAAKPGERVAARRAGEIVVTLRPAEGDRRRAGREGAQHDIGGIVGEGVVRVREHGGLHAAEHVLVADRVVEARDGVAVDVAAIGIGEHDAVVGVVGIGAERRVAGNLVVGDLEAGVAVIDQDAGGTARVRIDGGRIVEADIGDGVVVDRSRRAGEGAGRADLHAVLGLERRLRADDLVVVDVDGQPGAVGEDAGLLEIADGRILDLDMVAVGRAAMGRVVAGDDDRVVALVAGGFGRLPPSSRTLVTAMPSMSASELIT